jgi:poly(hydroxyalkanoate) depolymerase family esterase
VGRTAPGRGVATPALPAGGAWLSRAGALPYRLFRPAYPDAAAPLVVMLHGCTQTPEDFAAGTDMCRAADALGAHVIFPEQVRMANANACWNWFEPAHQGRAGEPAAIVSVVRDVLHEIGDARAVHAAGLSAGGAMAAILGAHYPDVVASVGIHSGLPVGAATDMGGAFAAMNTGGTAGRPLAVPAIVFHGTADRTVVPANAAALMPGGAAGGRTVERNGRGVTVTSARAPGHRVASELWSVDGLGHAWSGGSTRGSFVDSTGPDATAEMMRFFAEAG